MAGSNTIELTRENFQEEVLQSPQPVLVDFWADWCGPCKTLAPVIEELAGEYDDKVKFAKVNIDENQELAAEHGIRAVPTLLLFKDGQVVEQIVGMKSKGELKSELDEYVR